jgi:hypothetical protein
MAGSNIQRSLAGRMPVGAGASCRERLIRLKPGLLSSDGWMKHSTFINWLTAVRRLKPGLLSGDGWIEHSTLH